MLLMLCLIVGACQQQQTASTSLLNYLPNNALVVVKSESFASMQTHANAHVAATAIANVFPSFFSQLDAVAENTSGQLSFHPEGKDKLSYLWITHQKPPRMDSIVADTLTYAKTQLLQLNTSPPTYYATWDSLHLQSSSKLLMESSIRLRTTPNSIDSTLAQLYNSTKEAHTFFVHHKSASFFDALFTGISTVPWNEWSPWTAFIPAVNDNGVFVRAYGVLPANGRSRLSPLANQTAALQEVAAHVPSSAKSIQAFAFDSESFSKAAKRFQITHNQPETVLDSLLIAATQVAQIQLGNDAILTVKSTQELEEISSLLSRQSKAQYSISGQTLFEFSNENQKTNVLAPITKKGTYTHAAFLNEHLYLGTSKTVMETVLHALSKDDVLANDLRFQSYVKTLPRRSSFWTWAAPAYVESTLKKSVKAFAKTDFGAFRQVDYVGVVEGDVFYVTLSLQQPSASGSKSQAVESAGMVPFDTPIEWGPYAVQNHNSKALEWVVQDEENQLYLLGTTGKILWKKQLDGAILGPVHQVDVYRNRRLQLAFTTTKSFQVLDRNGNTVRGFTKTGMSTSSTLGIFDYDKQRNYRILLSTGNALSMYDRSMKKVSGWRKTKLTGSLGYPPKHIRIGNRDYIALVHKSGKGELLHRTGKIRIKIPTDIKFTQNIFPYQSGFVSVDNKNRLIEISTSGKITKKALPFETRYSLAANKNTLVTLTENKVTINNQLVELDFGVYAPPQIQVVNNRTYILIWDNQSGKVYVFNRDAKLLDSFPVIGEGWAMLGQGAPGSALYLAAQNNRQELRFYRLP
jgi:hypothetical protein